MAREPNEVALITDLRVQVPRNANGTLEDGVEAVVCGINDVRRVKDVDVTSLLPRLNDLQVDATVALVIAVNGDEPPEAAARYALADAFGVVEVDDVRIGGTETPSNRPVIEYG